jgi:hypothetical protein
VAEFEIWKSDVEIFIGGSSFLPLSIEVISRFVDGVIEPVSFAY